MELCSRTIDPSWKEHRNWREPSEFQTQGFYPNKGEKAMSSWQRPGGFLEQKRLPISRIFFLPFNKKVELERQISVRPSQGKLDKKVIVTHHQRMMTERCTWCLESMGQGSEPHLCWSVVASRDWVESWRMSRSWQCGHWVSWADAVCLRLRDLTEKVFFLTGGTLTPFSIDPTPYPVAVGYVLLPPKTACSSQTIV